jgi:predicted metal-dependent enzyme (double-stranded beta helix superfamily)
MQLLPHDHNMWALIGIYTGRETTSSGSGAIRASRRRMPPPRARGCHRPARRRHPLGRQPDR